MLKNSIGKRPTRGSATLRTLVALGFALALMPLAAHAVPERGNPHGTVWEDWQPMGKGFVARRRVPERLDLPVSERRSPATQERAQPGRDRRPWEQLSVWFYTDAAGLYAVNLDQLSAETGIGAGALHGAAQSGRLSIRNGGEPVSWHYDAAQRRLLFAGEHYETFHARGNAYQLVQTQTPDPNRMTVRNGAPTPAAGQGRGRGGAAPAPAALVGQPTPFREVLHFEEEGDLEFHLWIQPWNADARYWFWDHLFGKWRPEIVVPLDVPDPAPTGSAKIVVRMQGMTELYPGDDHRVAVHLNGMSLGTHLVWDGFGSAEFVAEFDQSLLHPEGANTLSLLSVHDAARPNPGQLLESVTVEYTRRPVAADGSLWLRGVSGGSQSVGGFGGPDILVIESPVRNAVIRRDVSVDRQGGEYAVVFAATPGQDYLVVETGALLEGATDARVWANLLGRGQGAEYLIIAPRDFTGTARELAEYRQARFGSVSVVWLDDIYKAFSAGRVDPFAIGRFMDHVRSQWAYPPAVVTLIGKGSLDRKDQMGFGDNFLPVLMAVNPWGLVPSDERLLGVNEGVAPFAIGRLPVTNDTEGLAYVAKLRRHEAAALAGADARAVLVADNPDSAGNFHADADRLMHRLTELGIERFLPLYHPRNWRPANGNLVRDTLIQSANWEDSTLVSYSGHGSSMRLGTLRENFLNAADAGVLSNGKYPVFVALTCEVGMEALPGTRSLAGALTLNADGGSIAAAVPAGLSLNDEAHTLAGHLLDSLVGRREAVGPALRSAKEQGYGRVHDFMLRLYTVIGDPAAAPNL